MALCVGYLFTAIDKSGNPLASGKVYSYKPNSLTEKSTYSDYALSVENSNPVVLDAAGQAAIHINGPTKLVIVDSTGRHIESVETANSLTTVTTVSDIQDDTITISNDLTITGTLRADGEVSVTRDVSISGSYQPCFYNVSSLTNTIGGALTSGLMATVSILTLSAGSCTLETQATFGAAVAATAVPNNSIFRDSADNHIKIKDNVGDKKSLY